MGELIHLFVIMPACNEAQGRDFLASSLAAESGEQITQVGSLTMDGCQAPQSSERLTPLDISP